MSVGCPPKEGRTPGSCLWTNIFSYKVLRGSDLKITVYFELTTSYIDGS